MLPWNVTLVALGVSEPQGPEETPPDLINQLRLTTSTLQAPGEPTL